MHNVIWFLEQSVNEQISCRLLFSHCSCLDNFVWQTFFAAEEPAPTPHNLSSFRQSIEFDDCKFVSWPAKEKRQSTCGCFEFHWMIYTHSNVAYLDDADIISQSSFTFLKKKKPNETFHRYSSKSFSALNVSAPKKITCHQFQLLLVCFIKRKHYCTQYSFRGG